MIVKPKVCGRNSEPSSGWFEIVGLVALAVGLLELGSLSYWFLPNTHWQRCVLALLVSVLEVGLPCLLVWQRPALASFDGRLLGGGIKPWLLALPLTLAVLLVDVACQTFTTSLDGMLRLRWWSDRVVPGMQSPAVVVVGAFKTIVITPIAEEVFFRGFVLGQLQKVMPATLAVLLQAILFSACHLGQDSRSARLVGSFVLGVAFGVWRIRLPGLLPLMVMHGLINALAWLPLAITEYDVVSLAEFRQMEALKDEPAERAIPSIINHLANPDIRVQICANVILGSRYRDSAPPYLREALSSPDPVVVRATISIIGEQSIRELIPDLRRLAWDHFTADIQLGAVIQLKRLGDTKALESIAVDHPTPRVRRAASRLLADPSLLSSPP